MYGPYLNSFFTTDPLNTNKLYMHDAGDYTVYYGTAFQGDITAVTNWEPNVSKQFEAIQMVTDVTPFRVDFATKDHTSFLTESEFTLREDFNYSPIKNNAVAGVTTGDSSRLRGRYLTTKLTFEQEQAQRLLNYVIKVRVNNRLYNR